MKNICVLIILILCNFKSNAIADEKLCDEFKKFSVDYFKCKGNIIKFFYYSIKTIS